MAGPGAILITGCSSGIGAASAADLVERGHVVYASARRRETLDELGAAGARTLTLDVTDEASMVEAVRAVEAEHGHVGTLVNNAGYGEYGPVEEVPLDAVRRQFDTNVFGLARLCQLVLPAMRAAGGGRIVNVSSMGGRLVFPFGGWYHASKYAVEALSDALRVEVAGFGVTVVLVEPGLIRTGFGAIATSGLERSAAGPYAEAQRTADALTRQAYQGRNAAGPEAVAAVIRRAVETGRPAPRYLVTPAARVMVHARRLGGGRFWDVAMRRTFRLPSRPARSPGA
jgi:NAD(P)-dependent dehydrogenase (short-subunit alcohol dehydrogenase family)